jgi:ribose transport system substrate-binding protein
MKIRFKGLVLRLAIAAILACSLSACQQQAGPPQRGKSSSQTAPTGQQRKTIGYSLYSMKMPWVIAYRRAFEAGLKEHPGFAVTWLDGNADNTAVAAGVEKWSKAKLDALVSMSPDHVPLRAAYAAAQTAGIPVLLTGTSPDYRLYDSVTAISGFSAWDAGRMAAEMLNQALGGQGQVARITAPRGSASEEQNTEGFAAALLRLGSRIKVVAVEDGKWDPTTSYQRTLSILEKFPNLAGICVSEDSMASAVIRALKEKGYKPGQVKVVAEGGSAGNIADLKQGWYLGIINQDPAVCAQQDLWLLASLLDGKQRLPTVSQAPQEIITSANTSLPTGW